MPLKQKASMKKKTPTKSSTFQPTIQIGKFDGQVLRYKFLTAAYKAVGKKLAEKDKKAAASSWKDFVASLNKIKEDASSILGEDNDYYGDDIFQPSSTCCGVDELTNLCSDKNAVICAMVSGFVAKNYYEDKLSPYIKYYDNLSDGRAKFLILKSLGWKCTGIFKNLNHGWHNYEYSAYYGD